MSLQDRSYLLDGVLSLADIIEDYAAAVFTPLLIVIQLEDLDSEFFALIGSSGVTCLIELAAVDNRVVSIEERKI